MPLVLVHNEVVANPAHAWDDVEGVHYHYPSKYRGLIREGEPFVYYRGVHRLGGKRGPAEYVGAGRIGRIWSDPSKPRAWYCAIEAYERFTTPVPAKMDDVLLEQIPRNMWRDGVRNLDSNVYERIMGLATVARHDPKPSVEEAIVAASADLIVPQRLVGPRQDSSPMRGGYRKSKRAKEIGDWAEGVALRHIVATIPGVTDCIHRAANGETPGWDIDYLDRTGVLQRVEVKGTTAAAFTNIQMTAGELEAAKAHGASYWLCLVAECLTKAPKVQLIRDPARYVDKGEWSTKAELFSIRFAR
ncbi:DUF3883 domain-containing protein [Rhodoblastus sp.]|uniref:protein NO VEIN domain-containing protein n=1 Tax=Rhodoblastus sp. TaxID=1962975 RepID=UPI002604C0A4|nr:DUF3883 domain-containing protein [Rhodoblastus sp.]